MLQNIGDYFANWLYSDASAVLWHVDSNYVFLQRLNAQKVFQFSRVPGQDNPADSGTNGLSWDTIIKHVSLANVFMTRPQTSVFVRGGLREFWWCTASTHGMSHGTQ